MLLIEWGGFTRGTQRSRAREAGLPGRPRGAEPWVECPSAQAPGRGERGGTSVTV